MPDSRARRKRAKPTEIIVTAVLSLILGWALWLFAWGEVQVDRAIKATLRIRHEDPDIVVTPTVVPVTITVKGPRAAVYSLPEIVGAYTVPSTVTGSPVALPIDRSSFNIPPGIAEVIVDPERIDVDISRIDRKGVAVSLAWIGAPTEGFQVDEKASSVSPRNVEITGPSSVIEPITEIPTEAVPVAFQSQTFTDRVGLDLTGLEGVSTEEKVSVRIVIRQESDTRTFKGVPIRIVLPAQPTFFPEIEEPHTVELTISGPKPALAELNTEDILVFVRVDKVAPTPKYEECHVILPEGKSLTLVKDPPQVTINSFTERPAPAEAP